MVLNRYCFSCVALPVFIAQQFVGIGVMNKSFNLGIPIQHRSGLQRDIGEERGAGAAMANFNIAITLPPALYAIEEFSVMRRRISGGRAAVLDRSDPRLG